MREKHLVRNIAQYQVFLASPCLMQRIVVMLKMLLFYLELLVCFDKSGRRLISFMNGEVINRSCSPISGSMGM